MIVQMTMEQIYALPGFKEMTDEYGLITDPLLPPPTYRLEDYLPLEKSGLLAVYAALRGDTIVGVATCIKGKMPHYGAPIAIVESLYLMREHRKSGLGIRLMEACEDCARVWAIPVIFVQVHEEELDTLGIILRRRNYSARIHTYGRRL